MDPRPSQLYAVLKSQEVTRPKARFIPASPQKFGVDGGSNYVPNLGTRQCDQMTILCFQYLAIFSNENLPKSKQIVPKSAENFAQNQIILKLMAKYF